SRGFHRVHTQWQGDLAEENRAARFRKQPLTPQIAFSDEGYDDVTTIQFVPNRCQPIPRWDRPVRFRAVRTVLKYLDGTDRILDDSDELVGRSAVLSSVAEKNRCHRPLS